MPAQRAASIALSAMVASLVAILVAILGLTVPAASQSFYKGKTLRIIVGTEAGGTADVLVRAFSVYLKRHLPDNPAIVVQNVTGAGGNLAYNFVAEKVDPDGLTIIYSPYHPLAQALGDRSLRVRYQDFEFLGGNADIRINYMRTDAVTGGARKPSDVMKADNIVVGAFNHTDFSGALAHLSLEVLGVRHKLVLGYRGGADVFLAMQRNEVQFHNTSIGTFRTRSAAFVRSGEAIGIAYLVAVDPDGTFGRNGDIAEMPAFPDLYREVHGKVPSGPAWEALNWLTRQCSELLYAAFAPRGAPPAALVELRRAFASAATDPEFVSESAARNGMPYSYVDVERGAAVVRALADVSPQVLATLRSAIGHPN
jgi:hypothetical protein